MRISLRPLCFALSLCMPLFALGCGQKLVHFALDGGSDLAMPDLVMPDLAQPDLYMPDLMREGCTVDGVFFVPNVPNPQNPCQSCQPGQSKNDFTDLGDGTSCDGDRYCQAGACIPGCLIDGKVIAKDSIDPDNACRSCQPDKSETAWSLLSDGTACGNGCNSCTAGACGPTGLSSDGSYSFIALDNGNVYWGDGRAGEGGGNAWSVPEMGGTSTAIGQNEGRPIAVAVGGGFVYVLDLYAHLYQVSLGDGSTQAILAQPEVYSPQDEHFDADHTWLYISDQNISGNHIFRYNVNTQALEELYQPSVSSAPAQFVLDGANLYYVDAGLKSIAVLSVGTPPRPAPTTLWTGAETPSGITVDATHVYFTTAEGSVYSVPKAGGSATSLASGLLDPRSVAVDGDTLYVANWNDGFPGGSLVKLPTTGGEPTVILGQGEDFMDVAIDGACGYASAFPSVVIWRFDK